MHGDIRALKTRAASDDEEFVAARHGGVDRHQRDGDGNGECRFAKRHPILPGGGAGFSVDCGTWGHPPYAECGLASTIATASSWRRTSSVRLRVTRPAPETRSASPSSPR